MAKTVLERREADLREAWSAMCDALDAYQDAYGAQIVFMLPACGIYDADKLDLGMEYARHSRQPLFPLITRPKRACLDGGDP